MRCILSVVLLAAVATALPQSSESHSVSATAPSGYWYEKIKHNGISPAITNGKSWVVYRNVKDYGAKGDGTTDDSAAIQKAISTGDSGGDRSSGKYGQTGQPAVVYFPPGTYVIGSMLKNYVGTLWMGDPINRPVIKASASFKGSYLVNGVDPRASSLIGFHHALRNLVFDTTAMSPTTKVTIIEWSVSQATQLSNIMFNMPVGAAGHGAIIGQGQHSPLLLNDLQIIGGAMGYQGTSTQYHFKNILFRNVTTGLKLTSVVQATVQGCRFEGVKTGIDTTGGGNQMLNLIDSSAADTQVLVSADANPTTASGSMNLENIAVDASVPVTVKGGTAALLTGPVAPGKSWIRGNVYADATSSTPKKSTGGFITTSRPSALVNSTGHYPLVPPPTFQEFDVADVINVKDVAGHPVAGDAATDDVASIQAILNDAAKAGKVVYFPFGIYLLGDTLTIPPGSRLFGEAWTQFSATGANFKDAKKPRAMIKIGNPGDVGVAQMTDFVFTVNDILPGAVLVEVNMAGANPGDNGCWHCHFRIGGARGSKVWNNCKDPKTCNTVRYAAHFKSTASAYWENVWAWSGDLDLDGGSGVLAAPLGGFLVESQNGLWLLGSGIEHHTLWQLNMNKAKNVFIGLMEGETSHWQGNGSTIYNPDPWTAAMDSSIDPDFSWCAATSAQCRMGLYARISGSSNVNIYSAGWWTFVMGPARTFCSVDCQDNAAIFENNTKLSVFGLSTINSKVLVMEPAGGGKYTLAVTHAANGAGVKDVFQTAAVAAYLKQSA